MNYEDARMSLIKKFIEDVRVYGAKYAYKHTILKANKIIDKAVLAIVKFVSKNAGIKNIIVIESHNDFDCNGGAFYNYLVKKGINKTYRIVWLIKNKKPKSLPENVYAFNIYRASLRKNIFICRASIFLSDDIVTDKVKEKQISIYCTHGGCTFKNVKGKIIVSDSVDYILSSSSKYDPFMCDNYSIPYPNRKMLHFGFPSNDIFFETHDNEFDKLSTTKFDHYFLWMPTFRKGGGIGRNDSNKEYALEIPLIEDLEQLITLNDYLKKNNSILTIKLHPMQEINYNRLPSDMSNIFIIDGIKAKELGLDSYAMMASSDVFFSDYSSASYSFLLLNRPIGFVIDDINEYKVGFTVDNIFDYLPGMLIHNLDEFISLLENYYSGCDYYKSSREKMASWMYEYIDGKACERLADFLNL